MEQTINLNIQGLGVIFYSPVAVGHISVGEDYLSTRFWDPAAVAEHVMSCRLSAFSLGSPGIYHLRIYDGALNTAALEASPAKARLGVEVRDGRLCFRDLYDLSDWNPECPTKQQVALSDGFYLVTAYTSPPPSGVLGDRQEVFLHLEQAGKKPNLRWSGVPDLCAP
jgi:hypothetical protein